MCPQRKFIIQILNRCPLHDVKNKDALFSKKIVDMSKRSLRATYDAYKWGGDGPAELPPLHWVIPDHIPDAVVKSVDAESPRDGDALEENEEEQTKPADGVGVENLEHVHATLMADASNYLGNNSIRFIT